MIFAYWKMGQGRTQCLRDPSGRSCSRTFGLSALSLDWHSGNSIVVGQIGNFLRVSRFSVEHRQDESLEPQRLFSAGARPIATGRNLVCEITSPGIMRSPSMPDSREQAVRCIEGANSSIGSVRSRCGERQIRAAGHGAPDIRSRVGGLGRRRDEHGFSPVRRFWFVRLDVRRNRVSSFPTGSRSGREGRSRCGAGKFASRVSHAWNGLSPSG